MSIKYGCEVCKFKDVCEQTPFGICKNFEEEKDDEQREAD